MLAMGYSCGNDIVNASYRRYCNARTATEDVLLAEAEARVVASVMPGAVCMHCLLKKLHWSSRGVLWHIVGKRVR